MLRLLALRVPDPEGLVQRGAEVVNFLPHELPAEGLVSGLDVERHHDPLRALPRKGVDRVVRLGAPVRGADAQLVRPRRGPRLGP